MTAQLAPLAVQKFFDNNGIPLAFGQLFTYIAGTTTKQATYTDYTQSTPNTNPIKLNAKGECALWLDPTKTYKLTLAPANDTDPPTNPLPGWPVDQINGTLSPNASVIPSVDNIYDLGSTSFAWRQIYVGANHAPVLDTVSGNIGYFKLTSAEQTALVTPTNYVYQPRMEIDVKRYGAVLDGATDDTTALRNALLVAAIFGGRIKISGFLAAASANVSGGALFTIPPNVEIVGIGRGTSGITVTGTTETHLFKTLNAAKIRIADLTLTGNNQSSAFSNASALSFQQDNTATGIGGSVCIERCRLTNFKGDYWLWFRNASTTYTMENFWIRDNVFDTVSGNSRGPNLLTVPDACVAFQGTPGPTTVGLIKNAWVYENTFNCNWKKSCGIAWESTYNIHFQFNAAYNCGVGASNSDKGAYAFMAYDNSAADGGSEDLSSHPDMIFVDFNQIVNPYSCGLYCADVNRVFGKRNVITGQVDTGDTTLPKAALSVSSALYSQFEENFIDSCYGGIIHVGGTSQAANDFSVQRNNRVTNILTNGFGCTYRATYVGTHEGCSITGNTCIGTNAGTRGIWVRGTSGTTINKIIVQDNPVVSGALRCCEVYSDDATVIAAVDVRIVNNFFFGVTTAQGLSYTSMSNASTRARISDNTFGGTWTASGTMCTINGSYGLTFRDNEFRDMTTGTGFALNTGGARGNFEGQRFYNVATARQIFVSGGEDLGYSTPTWTGWQNSYVQNLGAAEAGSASSKYVIFGWRLPADGNGWLQQRCLTGN